MVINPNLPSSISLYCLDSLGKVADSYNRHISQTSSALRVFEKEKNPCNMTTNETKCPCGTTSALKKLCTDYV